MISKDNQDWFHRHIFPTKWEQFNTIVVSMASPSLKKVVTTINKDIGGWKPSFPRTYIPARDGGIFSYAGRSPDTEQMDMNAAWDLVKRANFNQDWHSIALFTPAIDLWTPKIAATEPYFVFWAPGTRGANRQPEVGVFVGARSGRVKRVHYPREQNGLMTPLEASFAVALGKTAI